MYYKGEPIKLMPPYLNVIYMLTLFQLLIIRVTKFVPIHQPCSNIHLMVSAYSMYNSLV